MKWSCLSISLQLYDNIPVIDVQSSLNFACKFFFFTVFCCFIFCYLFEKKYAHIIQFYKKLYRLLLDELVNWNYIFILHINQTGLSFYFSLNTFTLRRENWFCNLFFLFIIYNWDQIFEQKIIQEILKTIVL